MKTLTITIIAGGAALGAALSAAVLAQPRDGGRRPPPVCIFYEHAQYGGERLVLRDGADLAFVGPAWNDRISSVSCDRRCVAEVAEHASHGGAVQRFSGEIAFVGPAWNDRISAIRVSCEGGRGGWDRPRPRPAGQCTVFEHARFEGRRQVVEEGETLRGLPPGWNDVISSVACSPGCEIEAFEHAGPAGASARFGETAFVGPLWNDRISALRVSCRPR